MNHQCTVWGDGTNKENRDKKYYSFDGSSIKPNNKPEASEFPCLPDSEKETCKWMLKNKVLEREWKRVATDRSSKSIMTFLHDVGVSMKLSTQTLHKLASSYDTNDKQ